MYLEPLRDYLGFERGTVSHGLIKNLLLCIAFLLGNTLVIPCRYTTSMTYARAEIGRLVLMPRGCR